MAAEGANVYVAWEESMDDPQRNDDIFFKRSIDAGSTFANAVNMSNNLGFSERPQLVVSGQNVYVAWTDDSSEVRQVMLAKSADGGNTFAPPSALESLLADPQNVELAIMPDQKGYLVYVAAQSQVSAKNDDILVATSADSGRTFGTFAASASANPGASECPSITVSGNNIYVAWEDLTAGNHDIFLARGRA